MRALRALPLCILPFLLAHVLALPATAAPVDLNTWTAESYTAVAGFNPGVWDVSDDGSSVIQTVNGQPTIFYSDFTAVGTDITGQFVVGNDGDDDFVGIVLGFQPGDTTNAGADYLLIDWKQATQPFDFGNPSTTPGTTANAGLAVSRVTGVPTADEFWGHVDFDTHTGGEVEKLARGTNLGATGFTDGVTYDIQFILQAGRLQVFVNGLLEIDISGSFGDGRVGFYNFSQAQVTYSAFDVEPATTTTTLETTTTTLRPTTTTQASETTTTLPPPTTTLVPETTTTLLPPPTTLVPETTTTLPSPPTTLAPETTTTLPPPTTLAPETTTTLPPPTTTLAPETTTTTLPPTTTTMSAPTTTVPGATTTTLPQVCPAPCGDPAVVTGVITAVDAASILRSSVGLRECALCVCDVNDDGEILATDALIDLQFAVGLPVTLNCPPFGEIVEN